MAFLGLPVLPTGQRYLTAEWDWYTGMDDPPGGLSKPNDDDLQISKGEIIVYTGDMGEGYGWAKGYKLDDETKTVKGFPYNYISEKIKPSSLERNKPSVRTESQQQQDSIEEMRRKMRDMEERAKQRQARKQPPTPDLSQRNEPSSLERKKPKREIGKVEKLKLRKIFLSLAKEVVSDNFDQGELSKKLIRTGNLIKQMNNSPATSKTRRSDVGGGRKRKKSKIRKRKKSKMRKRN